MLLIGPETYTIILTNHIVPGENIYLSAWVVETSVFLSERPNSESVNPLPIALVNVDRKKFASTIQSLASPLSIRH